MNKIKLAVIAFAMVVFGGAAFLPVTTVGAIDPLAGACADSPDSEICKSSGAADDPNTLIATIVNTLLFVVGALAVVMIIVAGIMYTTASGDASRITKAKNTLTYSIVGLLVSFLAFAIVNWVLQLF
jgi:hypothetical protein